MTCLLLQRLPSCRQLIGSTALLLFAVVGSFAGEASTVELTAPVRLELYRDGGRFIHQVSVPAGRTRIALTENNGDIIQVDGADGWLVEKRIDRTSEPPLPPLLVELAGVLGDLERKDRILVGQEETIARLEHEVEQRIGQRAVGHSSETEAWQEALDGMVALRMEVMSRRMKWTTSKRALRERANQEVLPGLTYASVLGMDSGSQQLDFTNPQQGAERAWRSATVGNTLTQNLIIDRVKAGSVNVVIERTDVSWTPRARLLITKGAALLVRQAAVRVPADMKLGSLPARLIGGTRTQPLSGSSLEQRIVLADSAPVAERRSVTTTHRAAGWAASGGGMAAREQSWDLPALTLSTDSEQDGEVMAELQKSQVALQADEWVLAPELTSTLMRRLSIRLDARPLASGTLELVVDGTVLGRRELPEIGAGAILPLSAGEDQRVFLAETTPWEEDPTRAVNKKREGSDYRLHNLSSEPVTFACYLTRPISAAKGVTVTVDKATTAGWKETQPGILRWQLTLKPGEEFSLQAGWMIEAEGNIKL